MTIVVVGSTHMDYTIYLDKFPRVGETVIGFNFKVSPGGKGANQAVAASRLGCRTYLVSRVGNDFIGKELINNLKKNNVNTNYVLIDNTAYTGIALIFVDKYGRNMIAVAPGADNNVSPKDVEVAFKNINVFNVVLTQLEIPTKTVLHALKIAKEVGAKTILNPAPSKPLPKEVFKYVDILTPNEVELKDLSNIKINDVNDIVNASRKLINLGVGAVVTTLGAKGALVVTKSLVRHVPTFKVRVVDTVGAGDAFNGALAKAISEGLKIDEAVRYANAVAALSVTKHGAQESMPTESDVNEFLRKHLNSP